MWDGVCRISCGSLLGNSCYSWRCESAMGGGVLALLASHIIDLTSYLGLGTANRVHATLRTLVPTTDNIGQSLCYGSKIWDTVLFYPLDPNPV
jgi:hypothetical protein